MIDFSFIQAVYPPQHILDLLGTQIIPNVDLWLLVHFVSGILLFFAFKKFVPEEQRPAMLLIILAVFEAWENGILRPQGLSGPETFTNIVLDIVVGVAGYLVAKWKFGGK